MSLDEANAQFWHELCGSQLAQAVGITDHTTESLARFDAAYMSYYPYLASYLDSIDVAGKSTLEIGIGFGTVARALIARGADYHAVDIAKGPVSMARSALAAGGMDSTRAVRASALDLPFTDSTLDIVVAIGSLHHTGDLPRAIGEVARVLRPGGRALIMVYNARSLNRLITKPATAMLARVLTSKAAALRARTVFDTNLDGTAAPHTDFVTRRELVDLFASFSAVRVRAENANQVSVRGRVLLPRARLLRVVGPLAGLDLYAIATR